MCADKWGYAGIAILMLCSQALAAEQASESSQNLSQLESLWSKLSDADRAKFLKSHTQKITTAKVQKSSPAKNLIAEAQSPSGDSGSSNNASIFNPNILGQCPGLGVTLRKSWTDIDLTDCPQDASKATGALLSYSNDQVKHNDIWTAQGVAALIHSTANQPYRFSTGLYTSLDKITNSAIAKSSSNADTVGYGGFLQFSVDNSNENYHFENYFRLRGGVVDNNIKDTTAANIVAEWIPVYYDGTVFIHQAIPIPGSPALFRIDPEIFAEYVEDTGKNQFSAFNNRTEALPVGPQVTLRLYPGTSEFWSHFVPVFTYWWAYEPYSGQSISWLDASLGYNLDKAGHVALSFSYERGNDLNNAGTFTNMYLLSLTGKL
jgi:hypothetical protein